MNDSTWTWMSGSDVIDNPGVYGRKGVAKTGYLPAGRQYGVAWYDEVVKELWIFGGLDYIGADVFQLVRCKQPLNCRGM